MGLITQRLECTADNRKVSSSNLLKPIDYYSFIFEYLNILMF
jgi:hypothetical protein